MSRGDDQWIQKAWYGNSPLSWLLLPLGAIFLLAITIRRWLYTRRLLSVHEVGAAVVVVGNVNAGGTGKTPVTLWLARSLRHMGYRPGIVSRGYGGDVGPVPVEVSPDSDPSVVGDEALVLAARSGCTVVVHPDRVAAAREAVRLGADVIVSDDGMQHYRLGRDVEIAVVDAARGFGNGRMLPAGPLREPVSRLRRVDAVVLNCHGDAAGALPQGLEETGALRFTLRATTAVRLDDSEVRHLDDFAGSTVHAIAGIGHPERFFSMLESRGVQLNRHPMPDHATLSAGDVRFDDDCEVLMTQKDAVKCRGFDAGRLWYVPVDVEFDGTAGEALVRLVDGRIRKRGRSS